MSAALLPWWLRILALFHPSTEAHWRCSRQGACIHPVSGTPCSGGCDVLDTRAAELELHGSSSRARAAAALVRNIPLAMFAAWSMQFLSTPHKFCECHVAISQHVVGNFDHTERAISGNFTARGWQFRPHGAGNFGQFRAISAISLVLTAVRAIATHLVWIRPASRLHQRFLL